jgi:phosphoribosyl-AMP cyclohydrolase / phosphoribosyl-ATP pyrophosphohydrolase
MKIDFDKYPDKLAPVIVQDSDTHKVLMLGFMNNEAFETTLRENKVVFFSRSKQRLWMKGEQSGNYLHVKQILADCDNDTLLIKAKPAGPVCHTGSDTCFNEINEKQNFIYELEQVITDRKNNGPGTSYTFQLFNSGLNRMAQKVGEEAVETVIAAKDDDPVNFINEAADLLFHYLVLLQAKGFTLDKVEAVLKTRHKSK